MDEASIDEAECRRKVASGRMVAGAIRSLVITEVCSLSVLVLHRTFFMPVLMYGSETRRSGLGLWVYKCKASEVCWVFGGWMKS